MENNQIPNNPDPFTQANPQIIINWIICGNLNKNICDEHGDSLFIHACRNRIEKLIQFLVLEECDINYISPNHITGLDVYREGNLYEFLRQHGAKCKRELGNRNN